LLQVVFAKFNPFHAIGNRHWHWAPAEVD
jgi:hypothetical protein